MSQGSQNIVEVYQLILQNVEGKMLNLLQKILIKIGILFIADDLLTLLLLGINKLFLQILQIQLLLIKHNENALQHNMYREE